MTIRRSHLAGFLLLLLTATGAQADQALHSLNLAIVDGYILPAYRAFADANTRLRASADAFCSQPAETSLKAARQAYHLSMDAFMAVQFIRFGPGEIENRPYRVQLYPERKNAIARHTAQILSKHEPTSFQPEHFARASAAVQGLPALERLLFEDEHVQRLLAGDEASCALARAITTNLAAIADATVSEWQDGKDAYRSLIANAGGNRRYRDDSEATLDLFKTLHGGLQLVSDLKLRRVLGDVPDDYRARVAESWRSSRSLRNVKLNLQDLERYFGQSETNGFRHHVTAVAAEPALAQEISDRFKELVELAASQPDEFEDAIARPQGYGDLAKLARKVDELREIIARQLSVSLGIPVGFNALDGD